MLALGANFSLSADSHLVAMQTPEGSYQTQAINILNKVQLHNMQTPEGSYQTGSPHELDLFLLLWDI